MEAVNGGGGGGDGGGGLSAPSPLTGCYLLVVVGEPHTPDHKDIILRRIAKGLLSWNSNDCHVDLEKELAIISEQAPEGEDAKYGERLIQFASENLVTEILIHPATNTLIQCMRNLLSSFTRHRHIIHSGYTFAANGSWILQDGTFSFSDFVEALQELDVQRVVRAYEGTISVDLHCAPEGDWMKLPREQCAKSLRLRVNPNDVLPLDAPVIQGFLDYLSPFLQAGPLEELLGSSDVVGNIRFSHPTLYVFPGGQGDAALFGINGFNMLIDGGFARKACFWDFVKHLDRLDAVLLTRLSNSNFGGIAAVLKRKKETTVYPQIGHFFSNIQERKSILSPDGDKDKDPLLINLLDEGQEIINNLNQLNLQPQSCYRDIEPINLYHKVGHGTLDMYVLSPAKDSKEVRDFLHKWNNNDQKLFNAPRNGKDFTFPTYNLVSICAMLIWQPANVNDKITRILFPGSTPQHKIFEGLDRLRNVDCIKHPVCTVKSLTPIVKSKQSRVERILQQDKFERMKIRENKVVEENEKNIQSNGVDQVINEKIIKKIDSTESEKSATKPIPNGKIPEDKSEKKSKIKEKPKIESKVYKTSRPTERKPKLPTDKGEKKPSPTTPKKTLETKTNGETKPKLAPKLSPSATPAKSTKEANNRKVVESKVRAAKKEPAKVEKKDTKTERKPISRRPKETDKTHASPIKKPDLHKLESRKVKIEKEGTDSSTVSTPSADDVAKKDLTKLSPEELDQLKARELADLKEEQEVVKELEAVFQKSEKDDDPTSDLRKIKDVSVDDKTEGEEYLIIEKEEIVSVAKEVKDAQETEKSKPVELEEQKPIPTTSELATVTPEDKITEEKEGDQNIIESQPGDEKYSTPIESGATTAPTLPEDERMPLDDIKEDQPIEEKHVKEDTKEKEIPETKVIETTPKIPPVVGIRLDKQTHMRDLVKTPDEVADLPVHEVVDGDEQFPQISETIPKKQQEIPESNVEHVEKTKEDVKTKQIEAEQVKEPKLDEKPTPVKEDLKEKAEEEEKPDKEEKPTQPIAVKVVDDLDQLLAEEIRNGQQKKGTVLNEDEIEEEEPEKIVKHDVPRLIQKFEPSPVITQTPQVIDDEHYGEGTVETFYSKEDDFEEPKVIDIKDKVTDTKEQPREAVEIPSVVVDKQEDKLAQVDTIDAKKMEEENDQRPIEDKKGEKTEQSKDYTETDDDKTAMQSFQKDSEELEEIDKKMENMRRASITNDEEIKLDVKDVEFVDKMELGRKSPKEREEDVAIIVASVAEVLKSDAPLEEFEGKIPLEIPTFELRETHITTLDSPVNLDKNMQIIEEESSSPKQLSDTFLENERCIIQQQREKEQDNFSVSELIKDSTELIQATSKIISDIMSSNEEELESHDANKLDVIVTDSKKEKDTLDKPSSVSGKSTPEIEITQDFTTIQEEKDEDEIEKKEIEEKYKSDLKIIVGTDTMDQVKSSSGRSTPEIFDSHEKSVTPKSGKSTPDTIQETIKKVEEKEQIQESAKAETSGKSTPEIKESQFDTKETTIPQSKEIKPPIDDTGKSTSDIKEQIKEATETTIVSQEKKEVLIVSGKSTPDLKAESKSGKSTPDEKKLIESGKSSPELIENLRKPSIELTTTLMEKSTEEIKSKLPCDQLVCEKPDVKELTQHKIIEEPIKEEKELEKVEKLSNLSGKSTPELKESQMEAKPESKEVFDQITKRESISIEKTSGKATPDLKVSKDQTDKTPTGKSTPDMQELDHQSLDSSVKKDTLEISKSSSTSGKSTPDVKELDKEKEIPLEVSSISGKSTPDIKNLDKDKMDTLEVSKSSSTSGKSTPELDKLDKDKKSPSVSGKSTPEIKDKKEMIETPDLKDIDKGTKDTLEFSKDTSRQSTPDIKELDKDAKISLEATKSPSISGISTPEIRDVHKDIKEISSSGKSTPDIKDLEDIKISSRSPSISGTSTPDTKYLDKDKKETLETSIHKDRKESLDTNKSGQSTPDIKDLDKDRKTSLEVAKSPSISGKSTPEVRDVDKDKKEAQEISKSGKSTPDIKEFDKDTKTLEATRSPSISGKSTPDIRDIDKDKEICSSGKSTPDVKDMKDRKESLETIKSESTPVIKELEKEEKTSMEVTKSQMSGKSTPEIKDVDKDTKEICSSGKSTPDVKDMDKNRKESLKTESTLDIKELEKDEKTSLEVAKSPSISGKSTPEIRDLDKKEICSSGKSTPDIKQLEKEEKISLEVSKSPMSGKSTPEIKDVDKDKKEICSSGKSTPDIKDLDKDAKISLEATKSPSISGITTPEIRDVHKDTKEISSSGKSTPDIKDLDKDTKPSLEVAKSPSISGKTTPEIKDVETDKKEMLEISKSGQSTPDIKDLEDRKISSRSSSISGTGISTPDTKDKKETLETSIHKDRKESLDTNRSGQSTPDIKDLDKDRKTSLELSKSPAMSGKSTPDIKDIEKETKEVKSSTPSGKSTPDIQDTKEVGKTLSGKSTPEVPDIAKDAKETCPKTLEDESNLDESLKANPQSLKKLSTDAQKPADDSNIPQDLDSKDQSQLFIESEKSFSKSHEIKEQARELIDEIITTSDITKDIKTVDDRKGSKVLMASEMTESIKDIVDFETRTILSEGFPINGALKEIDHKSSETTKISGKSTPEIKEAIVDEHIKTSMISSITVQDHAEIKQLTISTASGSKLDGKTTPPTAPVSPKEMEKKSSPEMSAVKSELRSSTPGSDDYDLIGSSPVHSDTSSGQVSRVFTEEEKQYSDEDLPGSPLSVTSQVAHSISSQDFEECVRGAIADPMSTSFYGQLPDDPPEDVQKSPSHMYEITTARYNAIRSQDPSGSIMEDVMTSSFIGDLPQVDDKQDPIASWGKPLGLPSPAPIIDNKGTPKKERKIPSSVVTKNKLNEDRKGKKINPIYLDLTYVPHHGNSNYSYVDFFKRVRARYYVFSGVDPSKEVYNALLEAKQTWDDKGLEVTIIPTYETDVLGYWVIENEDLLAKNKIDLSPSASRCTINLQDHETSCSAYRLEFS